MAIKNGGSGPDYFQGKGGSDWFYGNGGDDIAYGGGGNDYLYGGDDDDQLYGEGGDDYLNGGRGDDILDGGAGNDTLKGDVGNDNLTGGIGADTFQFNSGSVVHKDSDTIMDFKPVVEGDRLLFKDVEKIWFKVIGNDTIGYDTVIMYQADAVISRGSDGELDVDGGIVLRDFTGLTEDHISGIASGNIFEL